MVHRSEKGPETDKTIGKYPDGVSSEDQPKKACGDCGTTKTPLWRGGPAGPKSLCNACGIKSRKKRRAILAEDKKSKKSTIGSSGGGGGRKLGNLLKQRLVSLGREVTRQRSPVEKQRRKLREEEQAAVLLMALSYGSVSA